MTRRVWTIVAVVVALGGGIGLGALLFGGDDGDGSTGTGSTAAGDTGTTPPTGEAQGPTAPPTASTLPELPATTVPVEEFTGDNRELAEAINRAHQLSYHIVLRASDPDSTNETELWRRLPQARRDTRLGSGEANLETREFRLPERGHIGCLMDAAGLGQTTCIQAPPGELDPADPVLGVVDPAAGPVTITDETLNGQPIRCYSQTIEGTQHVACFDEEGIPAVLDGGDARLERVGEPERGITDDVFVVPDSSFIPDDSGAGANA